MFAHFRIPVVKSEGRVVLLQSKIKIKEKGTDKREEIEQEKEKKICKSIDKRVHAAERIFGTALAKILPLSTSVSRESSSEF